MSTECVTAHGRMRINRPIGESEFRPTVTIAPYSASLGQCLIAGLSPQLR